MRLYDTSQGKITLDGTDIKDFDFQQYRNCFGVVFQNYKVFDYSVLENITLQNTAEMDHSSLEKVDRVIEKVGLYNKIQSFERGVHTSLGKEAARRRPPLRS